jgi:hypothetical protein
MGLGPPYERCATLFSSNPCSSHQQLGMRQLGVTLHVNTYLPYSICGVIQITPGPKRQLIRFSQRNERQETSRRARLVALRV